MSRACSSRVAPANGVTKSGHLDQLAISIIPQLPERTKNDISLFGKVLTLAKAQTLALPARASGTQTIIQKPLRTWRLGVRFVISDNIKTPARLELHSFCGIIRSMDDSFSSARPVVGRLVALDFRPARPLTLLGPIWAVLCGAIATGGLIFHTQWLLKLILLFLLCDALLGAWRALWLHADWRTALPRNLASARIWLSLSGDAPTNLVGRLSRAVAERVRLVRTVIWPLIDSEISGMLVAGILALCISIVLGLVPTILTALALVLALIEGQLSIERGMGLRAIFEITLPWFIAQSAFDYFSWMSLVYAALFTLVYLALLGLATVRKGKWHWLSNAAQATLVLLLIASNTPAGAGIVALGLLAQVLWQSRYRMDRDGRTYAQRVQSYILVGMLVAGLSLWF